MVKQNIKLPKNSGKSPSFQFYYKDWLQDQKLRRASNNAKGVWIDLICCSMDMPVPGIFTDYVTENGQEKTKEKPKKDQRKTKEKPNFNQNKTKIKPLNKRELCQLLTGDKRKNNRGVNELISRNILKTDENGCFYVKRIKRDIELRRIRQEAGRKGGNPNLLNQNGNQKPTPSTSTSTSTSVIYSETSDEVRLSRLLFNYLLERNSKTKRPNIQGWAKHLGSLIKGTKTIPARTPEEIERVIHWLFTSDSKDAQFWSKNIRSTNKLRLHFDELEDAIGDFKKPKPIHIVKFENDEPSKEFLKRDLDKLLKIPEPNRTAKDKQEIQRLQTMCGAKQ